MHRRFLLLPAFAFLFVLPVRAGVGDPTLETNHPQYAGEGAFQSIDDCVSRATAGKTTPQDKAIAIYLWMLTHQYHLMPRRRSGAFPTSCRTPPRTRRR